MEKSTFNVIPQFSSSPIFTGTKRQCREFIRAAISGQLRSSRQNNWEDEKGMFCWCSATGQEFKVASVI